jgi:hypothetical protein
MQNLDLRHNLVFNPIEEKLIETRKSKIMFDHMSEILDKSLLSRMLPLYIGKNDKRSKKVFDLFLNKMEFSYLPEPAEYKLLIRYLRSKEVTFDDTGKDKIKYIFHDLINKDTNQTISVERIGQMLIQICFGIARFNNTNVCDSNTVIGAFDIYNKCLNTVGITSENMEKLVQENSIPELKTILTIKRHILKELEFEEKLIKDDLMKLFDVDLMTKALEQLSKDGSIYETRSGEIRGVK